MKRRASDLRGRCAARRYPGHVRAARLVPAGGTRHEVRHGRRHDRRGHARQESSPSRLVRHPRGVAAPDHGNRRNARVQPDEKYRPFSCHPRWDGPHGGILSAGFRLQRIETAFVLEETVAARDLDETMTLFEASGSWPYNVAWIDCLARGTKQGRSLVMRGKFMERSALSLRRALDPLRPATARRFTVPVDAPSVLLNRVSIRVFNAWYYGCGARSSRPRPIHFDRFFFPLDRLQGWNRLYGRHGFVQYQCVLPKGESSTGIPALLDRVFVARHASPFAVLKLFGPAGEGLLSFPMEGCTLTLNFPRRNGTPALLTALDETAHRYGGASISPRTPAAHQSGYGRGIRTTRHSTRSGPRPPSQHPSSSPGSPGGSPCSGNRP